MFRAESDPETGFSVEFEDNGRVAYGYILDCSQEIVGDVWLYNRCTTPTVPEWTSPDLLPFANPQAFVDETQVPLLPRSEQEITFIWRAGDPVEVDILLRGRLLGRLRPGAKPGWAVAAGKDGPLAKVLNRY